MVMKLFIGMLMILCSMPINADNKVLSDLYRYYDIEEPVPPLSNDPSAKKTDRAYDELSSWTEDTAKQSLLSRLAGVEELPVENLETGEMEFIKVQDIIDGKYSNIRAIMPLASAESFSQSQSSPFPLPTLVKTPVSESKESVPSTNEVKTVSNTWSSSLVMILGGMVLLFGLGMLVVALFMLKHGMSTHGIIRLNGLVLVIISSIFLVIVGYSQEQISPVMGLLGAIAGYLLGNTKAEEPHS